MDEASKKPRRCRLYMKSGNIVDLYGTDFSATQGSLENDLRKIAWKSLDVDRSDVLYLDVENIEAAIVMDES